MKTPRVRLDLQPTIQAGDRRVWRLLVDGMDAGTLDAGRTGAEVMLSLEIAAEHTASGVAQGVIGRVLGLAPWGPDVTYAIDADASDTVRAAARSAAFRRDDEDGIWRRPAPRPKPAADDITRFLDRDGRIDRYPLRAAERRALLAWVAVRAFSPGDELSEREVNDRLERFAPGGDVAVLRRYLVDHALLQRTPSGSQYAPVTR